MTNNALVKAWLTPNSRLAINFPFQHGKQIAHDTPMWTENGWKTHGELIVGDYVFAPNGMPVKVQALSPETMSNYEVVFSNGAVIQCHGNHEWYVYSRSRHKWCILETKQLAREKLRDGTRYNLSVPRTQPLTMPDEELEIPPYVLGAWLGDGKSNEGVMCHDGDDFQVVAEFMALGYVPSKRYVQKETGVHYAVFPELKKQLRSKGLINNKHIPEKYLTGSDEQRMELLAGLIDTDGSYSAKSGQYRFTNTNKVLVNQVAFLVATLGFKVGKVQQYQPTKSSSGIQGKKVVYVLAFSPTRPIPCRIPRKRCVKVSEACRIAVVEVRKCTPKPGRCIQVEGGLYLVGERLIPTHNSQLGSIYFPAWVLLNWPETRIALASYEESFACNFGSKVKDVVERFGKDLGIELRHDTKAKGEWVIASHGGGMVCKGRGGALVGRPADLLILDDLVKNPLSVDTPIPTPEGWKIMGEIKVGDDVFSQDGRPTKVTSVSRRWKGKRNRVHFSDGSYIDAHPDHKWTLFDRKSHSVYTCGNKDYRNGEWWHWSTGLKSRVKTVRTSEISAKLFNHKHQTNWIIPNSEPIDTPHNPNLIIDPYVLGVWLGDGDKTALRITTHKDDAPHYISKFVDAGLRCRLLNTSPAASEKSPGTKVLAFSLRMGGDLPSHTADSAAKRLKKLDVIHNKHVPKDYLRASYNQRMELLCGLMDTDGTVGCGNAVFCNTNKQLVDAVYELFVSLGAKATITKKENDYGSYWLVTSTSMFCPFSLPRKVAKWEEETGQPSIRRLNRTIVAVEEIDEEVEYVCIGVKGMSHLYLAGRAMIPTHNSEEAQSPTILESIWDWYQTAAYSRLGPKAPIIGIGTRWGPKDLFGRWEAEAKVGGDKFETILFRAIAGKDDILGRKPGEALWPERVPLARLQRVQKTRPRWFKTCWQGEPEETIGLHFQPALWPRYTDVGDAWRVQVGLQWQNYRKVDCTILHAADWAQAGKKTSNKTAIVTAALTPDGKIFTVHVFNDTLRYEENAPTLAKICERYSNYHGEPIDQIVASDDDMLSDAMAVECRRFRAIPEIRRLGIRSRAKIVRAQAGIIRSQNGLFFMPAQAQEWYEETADQLSAFSGEEGADDDIADCFGILGRLADEFAPGEDADTYEAALGVDGAGVGGLWS